jgi:hypothetical protein
MGRASHDRGRDGGVDVVDSERKMPKTRDVRRRLPVAIRAGRGVELHQLEPPVAVGRLHHRGVHPNALEPDNAVDPFALDRRLALQLEPKLYEEVDRGREVLDHDAHVLHALDRQALDGTHRRVAPPRARAVATCTFRSFRRRATFS